MAGSTTRRRAGRADFDDAFATLHARAYQTARTIVGDEVLAEELAVEALARLCADWSRLTRHAPGQVWAARLVVPLALDAVARRDPVPGVVVDAADDDRLHPDEARALKTLPRRQREGVALWCFAHFPKSEVADILGLSRERLESELETARDALHAALDAAAEPRRKRARGRA